MNNNLEEAKSLKSNIFFLFIVQVSTYIIPLIVLPYLVRVLGPGNFGLIAFSQNIIQYFLILTEYGFNLSATRLVAINRGDSNRLSEIVSSTIVAKSILMLVCAIIAAILVISIPDLRDHWRLFLILFLAIPGNVLYPIWLYQGLEKMNYITLITVITKLMYVIGVFVFVHEESDYVLAAGLQVFSSAIAGLFGFYLMGRIARINLKIPTWFQLKEVLIDGWHVFLTTSSVSLYTTSNIVILGLMTNNVIVGYFSAAEKIIFAIKGMIYPIVNAAYPKVNSLRFSSPVNAIELIQKITRIQIIVFGLVSLNLLFFAEPLVLIILGDKYVDSIELVQYMSVVPFFVSISLVYSVLVMLTFEMKIELFRVTLGVGLLSLFITPTLCYFYGATGVAASVSITELIILLSMTYILKVNKFKLI